MMDTENKQYRIYSSFDTETTNIKIENEWCAFGVAYMFGDIYDINIKDYNLNDEKYYLYRTEYQALEHIYKIINLGKQRNEIPIICAYNLMFDMQTIIYELNLKYDLKALAQSSTNVYTLDILEDENAVLRFWDCFHLDMRGLAAMGDVCGIPKLQGDWDYSLIRTSQTELTEDEKCYARRDIQVIPAYLRYLLESNPWITEDMLGVTVLTKTSIVRQMALKEIGNIKVQTRTGKNLSLYMLFNNLCLEEFPKNFVTYGLRKACFRGGFTFTSAKFSMKPVKNVCSLDVTSMHHAFINGRKVPVNFKPDKIGVINLYIKDLLNIPLQEILNNYDRPFPYAFHGQFLFKNIRLKEKSCFKDWGIGLIPRGKFVTGDIVDDGTNNIRNLTADEQVKLSGFVDRCKNGIFAFSKLMEAEEALLFLNEIEFYCVSQVYDFDSVECVLGESTIRFYTPPDYVTLQSMRLYKAKDDMKHLLSDYKQGIKNENRVVPEILAPMTNDIINGKVTYDFLNSFYTSTVKGMFNGIYGTMAQDILKPDYMVDFGELEINKNTITSENNYEEKLPDKCKVLYTYGMRIVAGSRMHLVIAMILLYKKFGSKIDVTGGDTDSLKIRCDKDIKPEMLIDALEPLHVAVTDAIQKTTQRAKNLCPNWASDLDHVGCFEVENSDHAFYRWHMELWNKARVSWDGKHAHVTCAGLSRPEGTFTYEDALENLVNSGLSVQEAMQDSLGFNVWIKNSICHALQHAKPHPKEIIDTDITDYLSNTYHIHQHKAIVLYPSDRLLGDTSKKVNFESLKYLQTIYNRYPNSNLRFLEADEKYNVKINEVEL